MNKQVIDVYDGMAMPADCARRIEGEMSRAIRQKKGKTKFMKNEKNGQKQSWGFAVVLVCLVLVLSVGGVFLFLNVSEPKDAPAAPVGTEQLTRPSVSTEAPAASTEADSFALSETGKAFLEKMCYFLPDWSDDASLNDEFWRNFLFSFLAQRLRPVYGQTVVHRVPWVKADNVVVAFYIFPLLVLPIAEIGAHTGNGKILVAAVQRGYSIVLSEHEPPVFIKGGLHGKLVMFKGEVLLGCAIIRIFRADMFECCQQRHLPFAGLQTSRQQGQKWRRRLQRTGRCMVCRTR